MKFDLEKALAGQLVELRDGTHAQVMFDLRRNNLGVEYEDHVARLAGLYSDGRSGQWFTDGRNAQFGEGDLRDIVGMAPTAVFNHWDVVDPKWKCIAADKDGDVYLYQTRPVENLLKGEWVGSSGASKVNGLLVFKYTDWETSLVERPA